MAQPLSYRESNVLGWEGDAQSEYNDDQIEKIKDPHGSALDAVTCAVPSPFARLERVKTAFENIIKDVQLLPSPKGQTHNVVATQEDAKLVSQTLDIAEMVFQRSIIHELDVVHWDFKEAKQRMQSKGKAATRFAETLEIYLNQDRQFNTSSKRIQEFDLIKFENKVIGMTSPSTLFAPADIDLSFAQRSLQGNRKLFSDISPLYERTEEFQLYLYYLFARHTVLNEIAPTFSEYLERNLKILQDSNPGLFDKIYRVNTQDTNQLSESLLQGLETSQNASSAENYKNVSVAGIELPMKSERREIESLQSGFLLHSNYATGKAVLVLPPPKPAVNYQHIKYLESNWDKNINVPYFNEEKTLTKRILPGTTGIKAAYLTVSDLLEPNIFKLPYKPDDETHTQADFFFGNCEGLKSGYLLPLKPLFFEYFSVADLIDGSEMRNGQQHDVTKPSIRFRETANDLTVDLFLPIRNNQQVRFQRTYYKGDDPANERENYGYIHEVDFNLAIYPKIRVPGLESFYKVQSIMAVDSPKFNVQFFTTQKNEPLNVKREVNRISQNDLLSKHATIQQDFDYIQLTDAKTIPATTGILIPQWLEVEQGSTEFNFAVDFGTTNTHIEYINNHMSVSKPFDITPQDIQLATLMPASYEPRGYKEMDLQYTILRELMPQLIGSDQVYNFPQRTVIAYSELGSESMQALNDVNIPFTYNKEKLDQYKTQTALKWQNANKLLAKLYFTELLMLIRNKVLLNKGNLSKTKIVTFYPSSMLPNKITEIESDWHSLFEDYISDKSDNLKLFPESIAPFYYYSKKGGTAGDSISIDIGGGTTDVVFFSKVDGIDKPQITTSFRFASNNIFGDGYAENNANNHPLIKKYYNEYQRILSEKNGTLAGVLDYYYKNNSSSSDLNAFLFSLEKHADLQENKDYHYSYKLKNDEQYRIVFLYFYSAIMYHIAQWLKHNQQPKPINFLFSGTGAKILNIIDSSKNYTILTEYTKLIFEKVLQQEYQDSIRLIFDASIAKEVTGKGGLKILENDKIEFNRNKARKLNRVFTLQDLEENITYAELESNKELGVKIVASVQEFNEFFLNLIKSYDDGYFVEVFGINSETLKRFEYASNLQLNDYLNEGIAVLNAEQSDKQKALNNSPFFYPIIDSIQKIMFALEVEKQGK